MRELKKPEKNQDLTEYQSVPPYISWALKQMSYEVPCHKLGNCWGIFAPIQECLSNKWNKSCFDQVMIATNEVILGLPLVRGFVLGTLTELWIQTLSKPELFHTSSYGISLQHFS